MLASSYNISPRRSKYKGADRLQSNVACTPPTNRPTPHPVAAWQPPGQQAQQQVASFEANQPQYGQQYNQQQSNPQQPWGNPNVYGVQSVVQATTGSGGTCGNGDRGDGLCPISGECCSQYGHCGTTPAHCAPVAPVPAVAISGATCGDGNRGNGICPVSGECCSQYGHCGTTAEHCASALAVPVSSPSATSAASSPGVPDTCGGGQTGNGICPDNNECCSQYGFCGTTPSHCANQVGNVGTSASQPQTPQTPYYNQQDVLVPAPAQYSQQMNDAQSQQVHGTCGGGDTGNGICPVNAECCSAHGFCGTTLEHCTNRMQTPVAPHGTSFKILGYYAGWQWYDRDKLAKPSNMDFRKVQRVNYAFFQPDARGNIFGTDRWGDPQLLFGPYSSKLGGGVQRCSYDGPGEVNCAYHEHNTGIIVQAHAQGAEVYPSIGGWTLSDNFPTLSADPVARDNFARKCVEILTHHDFDGIDIDWEYPGYEEHSGTPADTVNFTKMLTAIRAALEQLTRTTGKSYGLTAALPCAPKNIAYIEVEKLNSYLTEWNLMSYDFHGAWDEVSGVNAPLFYQGHGDEEFSIHSWNDLGNWPEDDGTPQFFNIWNKLPHIMIQMRDNKSKTQIAYISHEEQASVGPKNPDDMAQYLPEGLVSFDDERAICDKVHYAQDRGLAGFIIWEECKKERLEQESQLSHSQIGGFDSTRWGTKGTPGNASRERRTHGGALLILASSLFGWAVTVNTSFW
ncbi:hypothetical protein ACHAWF_016881 [Thalassiosira exigua]